MTSYLRQKLEKPGKNNAHNLTFLKTGIFLISMTLILTSLASAQVEFRDENGFDFYNELGLYSDLSVEDGNITMNNNRILGLPEPTSSGEPLTQGSGSGDYVDRTGDSMSGDLDLQDNFLLGDNGEIDFSSGEMILDQQMPDSGSPTTLQINQDGTPKWALVSMQDGGLGIYDAEAEEIVQEFNENGVSEINRDIEATSNKVEAKDLTVNDTAGLLNLYNSNTNHNWEIYSGGSVGGEGLGIYDRTEGNYIIQMKGNHDVQIHDGDLLTNKNNLFLNTAPSVGLVEGGSSEGYGDTGDLEFHADGNFRFVEDEDSNQEIINMDADTGVTQFQEGDLELLKKGTSTGYDDLYSSQELKLQPSTWDRDGHEEDRFNFIRAMGLNSSHTDISTDTSPSAVQIGRYGTSSDGKYPIFEVQSGYRNYTGAASVLPGFQMGVGTRKPSATLDVDGNTELNGSVEVRNGDLTITDGQDIIISGSTIGSSTIQMNNANLLNPHRIDISDPGNSEGIRWGAGQSIYSAPDDDSNTRGKMQYNSGSYDHSFNDGDVEVQDGNLDMQSNKIKNIQYPSDGAKKVVSQTHVTPPQLQQYGTADLGADGSSVTFEDSRSLTFGSNGAGSGNGNGGMLINQTIISEGSLSSLKNYLIEMDINTRCEEGECDFHPAVISDGNRMIGTYSANNNDYVRMQTFSEDEEYMGNVSARTTLDTLNSDIHQPTNFKMQILVRQDASDVVGLTAHGKSITATSDRDLDLSNRIDYRMHRGYSNDWDEPFTFNEAEITVYEVTDTEEVLTK